MILSPRLRSRIGIGFVALAATLTIVLPVTIPTILIGAAATALLAFDRRFGPLPAALLVMLAVPYDRAADVALPEIGGIPLRVQDGIVATGVLLALPRLRNVGARLHGPDGRPRPIILIAALFLGLGVVALALGFLADHAARDILRDARWWTLYAVVPLALATGTRWSQIARAVLVGATIFAVVVIVAALLPVFAQGLKWRALAFDPGLLRLQFGNTTFLLVALAYAAWTVLRRPTPGGVAWVVLLATAGGLSLTRTFIVVAGAVVLLVIVLAIARSLRAGRVAARFRASGLVAAASALGLALSIGVGVVGVTMTAWAVGSGAAGNATQSAIDRLLFQSPSSDVSSLGGRFETYRDAAAIIAEQPIVGSGLGRLVPIDYRFGAGQFDTPGFLPNVDDAYLTVGMKAGLLGILAFGLLVAAPLLALLRRRSGALAAWLLPAWLGILGLTLTQSFATTGYGPFGVGLLLVIPSLAYASTRASRARAAE